MSLESGARLGPYVVDAVIGSGGMGEVYRAQDTKLKRPVAIKVLPESVAGDPERLARFQREAEVLASLNHPNIAHIYGIEDSSDTKALVMELVEGPTLADRIAHGAIPVSEALPIARQIAEALEAAHERGIVHRDLKPANVKVREDGVVKVLDFGLAKAMESGGPEGPPYAGSASMSPTITTPAMTAAGMILGTAAYMSPEQARGKTVDRRADIWAFGCVFYEMLTGRRAFQAEDVSLTLAAVMTATPDYGRLPHDLPAALGTFLRRCLEKDPRQRVQAIGDVRLAIEGAFAGSASAASDSPARVQPGWRRAAPLVAATLVGVLLGAGALLWRSAGPPGSDDRAPVHFSVFLPSTTSRGPGSARSLAIAPDGSRIVYGSGAELYTRAFDGSEPRILRGTEGTRPQVPTFSPDGRWVAYFSLRDGQLQKVPVDGGTAVALADTDPLNGVSWALDDTIFFAEDNKGISRVPAAQGKRELLIPADPEDGQRMQGPEMLPDGRHVIFTVASSDWDSGQIVAQALDSGERRLLVDGATDARYLPTGHLVYVRDGALQVAPFDPSRLEVTGPPVTVVESVQRAAISGGADYGISRTGVLVYAPGAADSLRHLVWRDRTGRVEPVEGAPSRNYIQARISPDGTQAALVILDKQTDIWMWDFRRQNLTRVTRDPGDDDEVEWTPDGRHVVFRSNRNGTFGLYRAAPDGTSVEKLIEWPRSLSPLAFTADGNLVVTEALPSVPPAFSMLTFEPKPRLEPLFHPGYLVDDAHFSRDGRWMVYEDASAGSGADVFVRPFPDLEAGRWPIFTAGGVSPMWGPDGHEIFYFERGQSNRFMRVAVQTEPAFVASRPEMLFPVDEFVNGRDRDYDIAPDGSRFLMISSLGASGSNDLLPGMLHIEVVLNWTEELKRLAPAN